MENLTFLIKKMAHTVPIGAVCAINRSVRGVWQVGGSDGDEGPPKMEWGGRKNVEILVKALHMKLRKNFPLRGTYCLKVCRGFSSLATPLLLFLYPAPETVPDYEILTQTKSLTSVKIRKKFSLFSKNQFQKPTKQQFSSIFPAKETFEIFSGFCTMHYRNVEN